MIYENLDQKDKEICKAIAEGMEHEEIKAKFGVESDKIAQLRPIANSVASSEEQKEREVPKDEPADSSGEEIA